MRGTAWRSADAPANGARHDAAREYGVRLARRHHHLRAVAGAVSPPGLARAGGGRLRPLDGDSRDRVRGAREAVAGTQVLLGNAESAIGRHRLTRAGRPVTTGTERIIEARKK